MNQSTSKNLLWAVCALFVLGVSYWFCRFAMFDFHGMGQFPTVLAIFTLAVLALSLVLKKRWLSVTTDLGYVCGFLIGLLLNSDGMDAGGAGTNNLWMIWAVALLICIAAGIAIEIAVGLKKSHP